MRIRSLMCLVLLRIVLTYSNPVGSKNQGGDMLDFCARHSILPEVEIYPFERAQDAVNSLAHVRPHVPKYRAVMET
jgi:uncharacterized zinc-type alcohol dehydrogenase-like protein